MASYPGTPSKYPVTPSKYPVTPKTYPATGVAAYPGGSSVAASNPITIAAANGVTLYTCLLSDYGVTPNGTMFQTAGTLGPILGVQGATAAVVGLRVEIDSVAGGTGLGQATFRYSTDNGSTWIESGKTTSAAYNCTGAALGLQLQFLAGTYDVTMVYKLTAASWQDQTGNGHDFYNNNYTQCPVIETTGSHAGYPSLLYDGTDDFLGNESIPQLISGTDVPFSYWMVSQVMSSASSNILMSMGSSTVAASRFHEFQYSNSGVWVHNRDDNAAALKQRTTPAATANLSAHRHEVIFSGTDVAHTQDDVLLSPLGTSANLDVGVITMDVMALGARRRTTVTVPLNMRTTAFIMAVGATGAGFNTALRAWLTARYT